MSRDYTKETNSVVSPYGYSFQTVVGISLSTRHMGVWEAFQRDLEKDLVQSFTLVAPTALTSQSQKSRLETLMLHVKNQAAKDLMRHPNVENATNMGERALDFSYAMSSDYSSAISMDTDPDENIGVKTRIIVRTTGELPRAFRA